MTLGSTGNETGRWPAPELVRELQRESSPRESPQRAAVESNGAIGLVLGSGLARIADQLENPRIRDCREIPGYPASTVPGHPGRLIAGTLSGRRVWVLQGRVHLYEGYTPEEVTRPTRLLFALGVRMLILTNAAGSTDPEIAPGEIVRASDAINFFFRALAAPAAPAGAPPPAALGDLSDPLWRARASVIDPDLYALAGKVALENRIPLREGVLVGSTGPNYETAAEIALWRRLGGQVASMSTVPELLQARELGMRCLLFSLVTNYGTGLSPTPLTHGEVVERADQAGSTLAALLVSLIARL